MPEHFSGSLRFPRYTSGYARNRSLATVTRASGGLPLNVLCGSFGVLDWLKGISNDGSLNLSIVRFTPSSDEDGEFDLRNSSNP